MEQHACDGSCTTAGKEATHRATRGARAASAVDEAGQTTLLQHDGLDAPSPPLPEAEPYDPEKMNYDACLIDVVEKTTGLIAPFPFSNCARTCAGTSSSSSSSRQKEARCSACASKDSVWNLGPGLRIDPCLRPPAASVRRGIATNGRDCTRRPRRPSAKPSVPTCACSSARPKPEKWLVECLWLVDSGTEIARRVPRRVPRPSLGRARLTPLRRGRLGMCAGPKPRPRHEVSRHMAQGNGLEAVELLERKVGGRREGGALAHVRTRPSPGKSRMASRKATRPLRVLARTTFDRFFKSPAA